MKLYFQLQYKLIQRQLKDFGIEPMMGITFISVSLVLFSFYIFVKLPYAQYFYATIPFSFISMLSAKNRNDFLMISYPKHDFYKLRIIENLLVAFPFVIFLLFKQLFLVALLLPILTTLFVFVKSNTKVSIIVPTPFYKNPFEFIIGFRKSVLVIAIAYFIAFMAIKVSNFGLGIAAFILLSFVCTSFYTKPEPSFYVWQSSTNAATFLHKKIGLAILHFSMLALPMVIILCICFPQSIWVILLLFFAALVFVLTSLLSKYASFPQVLNPSKAMGLMFSAWFPPLLIVFAIVFYFQSIKSLQAILK